MSISTIIAIAVIVVLSVIAVFIAEEPLDEVFHLDAAMQGFPVQPPATKVTLRQDAEKAPVSKSLAPTDASVKSDTPKEDKFKQLVMRTA